MLEQLCESWCVCVCKHFSSVCKIVLCATYLWSVLTECLSPWLRYVSCGVPLQNDVGV